MTQFKFLLITLSTFVSLTGFQVKESDDYTAYHKQIIEVEKLLSEEQFELALAQYEELFDQYDFIFLRDYKIASQLALYLNDNHKAIEFLKAGMAAGWELKDLKKNKFLQKLHKDPKWNTVEQSYKDLHSQFQTNIDEELRQTVRIMFKKDQKKAMGALFRIGNKAQERYGTKKFGPHSESQLFKLIELLNTKGYPGEKLIGNNYWMSTIISHHNSISLAYVQKDTLYNFIKPKLIKAISTGEMSPYEFALIDDWQKAVLSERTAPGYGFLNAPKKKSLKETNQLRQTIGLRSIALRNKLIDVEKKTGMNFYLPDWVTGKIDIE